jgi:hypothetical protein
MCVTVCGNKIHFNSNFGIEDGMDDMNSDAHESLQIEWRVEIGFGTTNLTLHTKHHVHILEGEVINSRIYPEMPPLPNTMSKTWNVTGGKPITALAVFLGSWNLKVVLNDNIDKNGAIGDITLFGSDKHRNV